MLKLENSIRGLSFSRVAFDLTIQGTKNCDEISIPHHSFILVKFNFDKFTFTYLNNHTILKN